VLIARPSTSQKKKIKKKREKKIKKHKGHRTNLESWIQNRTFQRDSKMTPSLPFLWHPQSRGFRGSPVGTYVCVRVCVEVCVRVCVCVYAQVCVREGGGER